MKCIFCGKNTLSKDECCSKCEEGSHLVHAMITSIPQLEESERFDNLHWKGCLSLIAEIIKTIDNKIPFLDRANKLQEEIIARVKHVISFYHPNDLIIATLIIKEIARINMIQSEDNRPWYTVTEYEMSLILQQIIVSMNKDDFLGHSLDERDSGYQGLITAITLGRALVLLRDNVERYHYKPFTDNLMDLVTGLYEDDSLVEYFEQLIEMGPREKPEDIEINDTPLKNYLQKRGLLTDQILESIQNQIEELFGFKPSDIIEFLKPAFEKQDYPLLIIKKEKIISRFKETNASTKFENILKIFSLNEIVKQKDCLNERYLELRSIYEAEDFLVFGQVDMLQNIHTFESLISTGHYIEMYLPNVKENQFINSQQKFAKLLSFGFADMLKKYEYKLPVIKNPDGNGFIVQVDINKIECGKKNILQGIGDIDVLAINEEKNELLIIELKHFKPAMSIKDMVFGDTSKIAGKNLIDKVMRREEAIRDNLIKVIEFIGGDPYKQYKIRTIIVTTRPNFYAIYSNLNVEFITWTRCMGLIASKSL